MEIQFFAFLILLPIVCFCHTPQIPPQVPSTRTSNISGQSYKLYTKVNSGFVLTGLDDGRVVMSSSTAAQNQEWIRDLPWGPKLNDPYGCTAFALVNKGTGMALRHGTKERELVGYDKSVPDDNLLWTMSHDFDDDYHTIRAYANVKLNMDVDHGTGKYGGVKEGNSVMLFAWREGDNQLWRMTCT